MISSAALEQAVATAIMMQLQLNLMLTVPLKDPSQDISLGIIMIANYDSPTTINSTESITLEPVDIDEKNRKRRTARIRRDAFYHATEALFETFGGVNGRACLLRSICEAAIHDMKHDGLVGELLHVLLTPSSTKNNGDLHDDYNSAETLGKQGADCSVVFSTCPVLPLDLISTLTPWGP